MVERAEHRQRRVEAVRRPPAAGRDDGVAAAERGVLDAGEVERDAVARPDAGDDPPERLDGAHPAPAGRQARR